MNFEEKMNPIYTNCTQYNEYMMNLLQNQLLFQYIQRVEQKEENTKTQDNLHTDKKLLMQNELKNIKQQTITRRDNDQSKKRKTHSEDEDSLSRVNGHWSDYEHQTYLQFVDAHKDILRSKYDKKSKKIFKLMSEFITTRTAAQCRSHHQKFNPLQKGKKKGKSFIRPIPSVIIQEN